MDDLRLARALCTRLCHDLVGPVGAVANGLELLEEVTRELPSDILDMLRASAETTAQRLRFFRAAFGLPTPATTATDLDGIRELAEAMFGGGKVTLIWPESVADGLLGRAEFGQLLLTMLWCAAEALPRGGRLALRLAEAGPVVVADGGPISLGDGARRLLTDDDGEATLDPRALVPFFVRRLAESCGRRIRLDETTPERLTIAATA